MEGFGLVWNGKRDANDLSWFPKEDDSSSSEELDGTHLGSRHPRMGLGATVRPKATAEELAVSRRLKRGLGSGEANSERTAEVADSDNPLEPKRKRARTALDKESENSEAEPNPKQDGANFALGGLNLGDLSKGDKKKKKKKKKKRKEQDEPSAPADDETPRPHNQTPNQRTPSKGGGKQDKVSPHNADSGKEGHGKSVLEGQTSQAAAEGPGSVQPSTRQPRIVKSGRLRRRTKTRSKQKNRKRDTRPDDVKQAVAARRLAEMKESQAE
eukprot:Rmarinus@m.5481